MGRGHLASIFTVLLLVNVITSVYASNSMAKIVGEVLGRDELGNITPLSGVVVKVEGDKTLSTKSGSDGTFSLEVPAGGYIITASAKGHLSDSRSITVQEGGIQRISIFLERSIEGTRAIVLNIEPKSIIIKPGEESSYSIEVSIIGYPDTEVTLAASMETRSISLEVSPPKIHVFSNSSGKAIIRAKTSQQITPGNYVLTVQASTNIEGSELLQTERIQLQVKALETPITPSILISELTSTPYIYGLVVVIIVIVLGVIWKRSTQKRAGNHLSQSR